MFIKLTITLSGCDDTNEEKHMVDPYFEGARTKIQELAKYFEMDEKLFMEMIWNSSNEMDIPEKSCEMIGSMAYSFGLI